MEVIWRPTALNDINGIHKFIAQDNPAAAARVYSAISTAVGGLAAHSSLGRPGRVDGTRELVISRLPYIVVYRVLGDQVRVLAVVHTSRDWPKRFLAT